MHSQWWRGRGRGWGGVSSITAAGTDGEQLLWMEMCFDDGDVLQCSLHLQLCCHCYALASCPEQREECSLLLVTALFTKAAPQDPLNISRQLKYFTYSTAQLMCRTQLILINPLGLPMYIDTLPLELSKKNKLCSCEVILAETRPGSYCGCHP